jgi:hypothetical protein
MQDPQLRLMRAGHAGNHSLRARVIRGVSLPVNHRLIECAITTGRTSCILVPASSLMALSSFVASFLLLALTPQDGVSASAAPALHQQELVRESVRQGHYVPLEQVLEDALRRYPGKLVEVELEDDDEYEIEILGVDGIVMELEYDAITGKLLKIEVED